MRPTDMAAIHCDEFKRDAVRIALTSGLTWRQVASDLGIGLSTLGKWVRAVSEEAKVPAQDAELLRENERLRKANRILGDLSRNKKRSGGAVFRRMWEVPKKWRCSSRHKSRKVWAGSENDPGGVVEKVVMSITTSINVDC